MKKILNIIIVCFFFISCRSMDNYLASSYVRVYKSVIPSVVEILAVGVEEELNNNWYDSFNDSEENIDELKKYNGIGSGFIYESQGDNYYIVTNKHVVGDLSKVQVILYDKSWIIGDVVGFDERFDLAVVKIVSDKKLRALKCNLNKDIKEGEFIAVIGSPMGYSKSISMGIISNYGRYGGPDNNISNYIQTDAAINQGNSGGPMVNLNGEVIGLNTWILAPSGGSIGLGFAVPIININNSIRSIIDTGVVNIPWLGIVSNEIPKNFDDYRDQRGAFISQVVKDSPAYSSLKPGDIIKSVNSQKVESYQDLILIISLLSPNDEIAIKLIRDNKPIAINLVLESNQEYAIKLSKDLFPGITISSKEDELYILNVLPKSVGQQSGLKQGDIIKNLNGQNIIKEDQFYSNLKMGINLIIVSRDDKEFELELDY